MHIPASMLHGMICPVTVAVSALGVGAAAQAARKSDQKPSSARFAAVTALIFGLQMLNYPVSNGTSGHLLGGVLAVSLLGVPFAILSMSIVLAVQAVFFGDGGINALGANVLNMAIIGAGFLGFAYQRMQEKGLNQKLALGIASLFSVVIAAFACSLEVAAAGAVALNKVLPAMLSVHVLIGLGEALLTIGVVTALSKYAQVRRASETQFAVGISAVALFAAFLSPLASRFPDGLEWVATKLSFAEFSAFRLPVIFPDYQAAFIAHQGSATILAGLAGIGLILSLTFAIGQVLQCKSIKIT